MLETDVLWEYRQIKALEYELKHGKPMPQVEVFDDTYEQWQEEELGITKEAIEEARKLSGG